MFTELYSVAIKGFRDLGIEELWTVYGKFMNSSIPQSFPACPRQPDGQGQTGIPQSFCGVLNPNSTFASNVFFVLSKFVLKRTASNSFTPFSPSISNSKL